MPLLSAVNPIRLFQRLSRARSAVFVSLFGLAFLSACGGGETDAAALGGPPPVEEVRVTVSKVGSGMVTSTPEGIACGSVCDQSVPVGTDVTLSSIPDAGYDFVGWSGSAVSCSGIGACTLTADAARSITAIFSPRTPAALQVLSVDLVGAGRVVADSGGLSCSSDCSALLAKDLVVVLTATPAAGQVFSGWSGSGVSCPGTGTCQVTMDQTRTITATFVAAPVSTFALSLGVAGSGSVASTPAGIACSANCTSSFASGTSVLLAATPSAGFAFTGWSGACSGNGACVVTMSAARSITATFSPIPNIALNTVVTGSGTVVSAPAGINCGTSCSASFAPGSTVALTAAPAAGYSFSGWSGGGCTGTGVCNVRLSTATTVTATFALIVRNLSVSKQGSGSVTSSPSGISCGATCNANFSEGTVVTLAATPAAGQVFSGWSGACTGTASCSVTMTQARSVTATFAAAPVGSFALGLGIVGSGSVASTPAGIACSANCSGSFTSGTVVNLTASPGAGQRFTGWSGACTGTANCSVTMTQARSVTATFAAAPVSTFALNLSIAGSGSVASTPAGVACAANCSASFASGTVVTLAATPAAGQVFSGWSGACIGTANCSVTMTQARSVTATFAAAPVGSFALSLGITGSGSVASTPAGIACSANCSGSFTSGTVVNLTAWPGAGQVFSGWNGACTGTANCSVTMTQARSVTATFAAAPVSTFALNLSIAGSGSVASTPAGIACAANCSASFASGTAVTLAATPAAGQVFSGWSGACTGTASCSVTMTQARSVTATFAAAPVGSFALSLGIVGSGSVASTPAGIACSANCSGSFTSGTVVTLIASPGAGQRLSSWSGACTGSGSCVVTMSAARSVTAIFSPVPNIALTTVVSGSGTVVSAPAGINCAGSCSASFAPGTTVTLTATPAANYSFAGWSGSGCSGMGVCSVQLTAAASVTATFTPIAAIAGAPVVAYTDAVSGPVSGGEGNLGAYLSIFGSNFGSQSGLGTTTKVFIGTAEVANYRFLGNSKVAARIGLQQLTVQVGNLGNPAPGQALPVKVVVNGVASNTTNTFTPNPGRVLFVALNGNDSTALAGDIARPWRHLQTSSNGGVGGVLRAGDHIVIRGGNWSDTGFDGAWLRFRYTQQQGSSPTGASGTGWIHITAYPGPVLGNAVEDVHYSTPANVKGGIHGASSAYYGTTGDWISISNLRMDVNAQATSDAAPINLQSSAGPWRVVNNELGPWPSTINSKAAGVSGHGANVKVLGNHIYGMACTGAKENHGVYVDSGGTDWEIAYNWVHDITGGNLIQFFDNVGLAGNNFSGFPSGWQGFTGMKIHHNWLDNSAKYGLNLADGIVSGSIWNNVIARAQYAGIRINTISRNMDLTVAFNTFYDNDRVASGSGNAQVLNTWGNYNPTGTIRIYDNIFAAGPATIRGSSFYENAGSADGYLDFKRNLYWDNGYGWGGFSRDTLAVFGDPRFAAATSGNLRLTAGSAAIDRGTQPVPLVVNDDFTGTVSRPQFGASDLGAFEAN